MEDLWKLESVELSESRQFVAKLCDRLKSTRDPTLLGELVEYYFKNGSKRARTVLTSLREAHSQDYFDKLHESILKTSTRLPVLKLLAHTLNSETSWLYRVVDHPLFAAILDQLKTSRDIVVLCSGVFVVTAILPLVPSYIGPHLHDLLTIFISLATIRDTRRLGLTPKELCLNLDVAVYYLFLQLYALFPNNLFHYLRQHSNQPHSLEQFNNYIAPLFYQVQLHPSLVTGGSSYELSRSKWGSMEPDDIATLSLQLCLDTQLTPDYLAVPPREDPPQPTNTTLRPPLHTFNSTILSDLPPPTGLKTASELDQFWSPLVTLSSAPPTLTSSNISPNDSSRNSINLVLPITSASGGPSPGSDSALSSTLPTPRGNALFTFKNYSPTASIDSESKPILTQSASHITAVDESGVTFDPPLSQSLRVEPSHSSPARKNGRGLNQSLKERVGQLIGRLVSRNVKDDSASEDFTELCTPDTPQHTPSDDGGRSSAEPRPLSAEPRPQTREEVGEECKPCYKSTSKPQSIPSSRLSRSDSHNSLPDVGIHGYMPHPPDHPGPYSYPESGPSDSVTCVKRVRASSSECTTRRTVLLLQERLQELVESGEQYEARGAMATSTPLDTDEVSTTNLDLSVASSATVTTPPSVMRPLNPPSGPLTLSLNLVTSPQKPRPLTPPLSSSLPSGPTSNNIGVGLASRLFVKRVSVCSKKQRSQFSESSGDTVTSDTTTNRPSPLALLDQYIERGVVLHKGHFESIPLTELEGVDWNHFGGCPHSEEFGLMQTQAVLLHSQLMFERCQCMQHARRNRTLLNQARGAAKLAEEAHRVREQLDAQNTAVQSLQIDLQHRVLAHGNSVKLQEKLRCRNQLSAAENKQLRDSNLRLAQEVKGHRERNQELQKRLDHSNNRVVSLENNCTQLHGQLDRAEGVKQELQSLSEELLTLGDLYQQSKERLPHASTELETASLCRSLTRERDMAEAKRVELMQEVGVVSGRVKEVEALLLKREREIDLLKNRLAVSEGQSIAKQKALEDKYESMKSIALQLESHVLELKGRTPIIKKRRHKRSISQPTEAHPLTPHPLPPH